MQGHVHGTYDALAPFLGAPDLLALVLPLFIAGLLGGATHCVGMCGPFVLSQVGARLGSMPAAGFGGWARLRGSALAPYHFGRMTTYTALGALVGGAGSVVVRATEVRWLLSSLLLLGATLLAAQALGWHGTGRLGRLEAALTAISRPLVGDPRGWRGYALGVTLGFLPCGMLYGALAVAAGSGSTLAGAVAMAVFVLGTVPGLVAVGWGGALLGTRRLDLLRRLSRPLLALNALVLAAMAVRALLAS
jgi:sulfite exporter TauE/SafE